MTNNKKYRKIFDQVASSKMKPLEVSEVMKQRKTHSWINNVAAAVALVVVLGSISGIAYAADFGGIQRNLQLWIHGDQTEVVMEFNEDGTYKMEYKDISGTMQEGGGGGVAIEADGSERPLTEEELLHHLNGPEVEYEDDGTVWVYYYNQKIDITDNFEDGVCYVKVSNRDETLYMTIKHQNGWSTSPHKYISPNSFN